MGLSIAARRGSPAAAAAEASARRCGGEATTRQIVAHLRGLLSSVALLAVFAHAGTAQAQTPFTSLTIFSASYSDFGNASCFAAKGFANCPYPSHVPFPSNPPTDTMQIVPFTYTLRQLYRIPSSATFNYAIAGADAYSGSNGLGDT